MFTELRDEIARAALAGADLAVIDDELIRSVPIDEEEKSVLWLYAQALTDRPERVRAPRDLSWCLIGPSGLC